MKQYICDRCGAIIPLYKNCNHVLLYDKGVLDTHIQYQLNNTYNECDLCDDCLEHLDNINQVFMENCELVVK